GNIIKRLFKAQTGIIGLYPVRVCTNTVARPPTSGATPAPNTCPVPETFALDGKNARTFTLDPPVRGEVYYRVTGSVAPEPYGCDIDQELCYDPQIHISAMHYARYFAFSTESESASSRTLAQENLTVFFRMLKIFKDEDKSYCKEFCKP
ncbi:MAG: hypothetical protein ACRC6G_12095, partial [Deefgea sp.]